MCASSTTWQSHHVAFRGRARDLARRVRRRRSTHASWHVSQVSLMDISVGAVSAHEEGRKENLGLWKQLWAVHRDELRASSASLGQASATRPP